MQKLKYTFLTTALLCTLAGAATTNNGYEFKSNVLVLHTTSDTQPELYLFYNKSKQTLLLSHPHAAQGASAGWDSKLGINHWSAFMVNRPNFAINCAVLGKSYQTSPANCAQVLTVRRYDKLKITNLNVNGTFWVAEDGALKDITARVRGRGLAY